MKEIDYSGIYLQDIKIFLLAADLQNYSLVGRMLGIAQSTVSKSIARLENQTQLILFVKKDRRITLTPAGETLKEALEGMMDIFDKAVSDAHLTQTGIDNQLRIGIPNETEIPQVLDIVTKIKKEYPDAGISVEVEDFATLRRKLIAGESHLIFTVLFETEALKKENIAWRQVSSSPLYVFLPESHPLASRKSVSVGDLRKEKFIVHSASMVPGYIKLLNELCEPYGFTPLIAKYTDNLGSFFTSLLFGDGILIGDDLIKNNFQTGIKCFPLKGTVSGKVIAWNKQKMNPLVKKFLKLCKS